MHTSRTSPQPKVTELPHQHRAGTRSCQSAASRRSRVGYATTFVTWGYKKVRASLYGRVAAGKQRTNALYQGTPKERRVDIVRIYEQCQQGCEYIGTEGSPQERCCILHHSSRDKAELPSCDIDSEDPPSVISQQYSAEAGAIAFLVFLPVFCSFGRP